MIYDYAKEATKEMEKSSCEKRKVGCVIVDEYGQIVGRGHNKNTIEGKHSCEDVKGDTLHTVVHAEIVALGYASAKAPKHLFERVENATAYVTHAPCENCARALAEAGITDVRIVETGIKLDKGKAKLSLIPTQLIRGVGEVMTFGAKRYKKNNWKNLDDPSRYLDALMRHLEAYRSGEEFDEETGLPHLAHLATNAGFLLFFDENRDGWQEESGLWD